MAAASGSISDGYLDQESSESMCDAEDIPAKDGSGYSSPIEMFKAMDAFDGEREATQFATLLSLRALGGIDFPLPERHAPREIDTSEWA